MADRFEDRRRQRRRYEEEGFDNRDYERDYNYRRGRTSGRRDEIENDWDEDDYGQGQSWTYTEIWWVPGPETGRGPRGYRRSDDRIKEEVCERLTWHGQVDASDIEIDVKDGEVTLQGTVPDRRTKRRAEDVTESVTGVVDVHNQLRIGSLGWAEGQAHQRESDSIGWAEGQASQREHESKGWAEGQASQREDDSIGWSEGQARDRENEPEGWSQGMTREDRTQY